MTIFHSRRALTALGMAAAMMAGCLTVADAQTAPRSLQGNPDNNNARPDSDAAQNGNGYGREHLYNENDADTAQTDREAAQNRNGYGREHLYNENDDRNGRAGDRLDRRLDYLHAQLRITAGQERAWDNFADAVRDEAPDRTDGFRRRMGTRGAERDRDMSVVQRLERRGQMLDRQRDRLDHLVVTLRPLYASLTADQKRAADRELFHPERQRFAAFRHRFEDRFRGQDRDQDRDRDNQADHDTGHDSGVQDQAPANR
jgi:hypothetical protein